MPTAFSQGIPDGSQHFRPIFDDARFEMVKMDMASKKSVALPWTGLSSSSTGAAGLKPRDLQSGVFLSLQAQTAGNGTGYGSVTPYGTGLSVLHSTNFHDYAPTAVGVDIGMVFLPYGSQSIGSRNNKFLRDANGAPLAGPVLNPDFEDGAFNSEAITILTGNFRAWVPVTLLSDATITGYAANGGITVINGRPCKAVAGNSLVGKILAVTATLILIEFNIVGVLPVMV